MIKRRKTKTVNVGGVKIGSDHPVRVQSMAKTDTCDIDTTVGQIQQLEEAGCELVRVAVKDASAARALAEIKKSINIPLIADIHFDYRLALEALDSGADKIRINPGNIGKTEELERIIDAAMEKKVPVRIGVNSGSLTEVANKKGDSSSAMADSIMRYLEHFQKKNFHDIVISVKSSCVTDTVEAYRKISSECDYPLHVGITAAGTPQDGIIKSSVGIGTLLMEGIGDTIRVSLTGDPLPEVEAAKKIISASGLKSSGLEIIACPTCGRCQVDMVNIVKELEEELNRVKGQGSRVKDKQLIVAVMGCEVNGPGEAKNADIGIAFGSGKGAIFRKGEIVKTVKETEAVKALIRIINE